jgi:hypothetical protein
MKEEITIPIYFYLKEGKIIIDIESMQDEFNQKLSEVLENPSKFLEVEL